MDSFDLSEDRPILVDRRVDFLGTVERLEKTGYWRIGLVAEDVFYSAEVCHIHGKLAGYAPRNVAKCVAWYHRDDRDLLTSAIDSARRGNAFSSFEARLVTLDDRIRWVRVAAEVQCDAGGNPMALVGTLVDVTARRTMAIQLAEATRDAHAARRMKETFLANMNHELRTPLNAIIGFSQLLQIMEEKGQVSDQVGEYATDIARAGAHLLGIVEDIFSLSKLEAEAGQIDIRPVDIQTLLDDVRSKTRAQVRARGAGRIITYDLSPRAKGTLRGDRHKILQIIVNLVSNAVKFSPASSPIVVKARRERTGRLLIEVVDRGPGIPEHLQGKIFEHFERLDATSHAIEGIGVGLAIARSLVSLMGGEIGVRSVEGEGATFWLAFPVDREEASRAIAV